MVGSIINKVPILQQLTKKLTEIVGVKHCVVFKIIDGIANDCVIEIAAGVPIEEHGIGLKEPLSKHPDIAEALRSGTTMRIKSPEVSPLTSYFNGIIKKRNINEILYIPIISKLNGKTVGMIVIDAVGEKGEFSDEEIEFCSEVGELISLLIGREEILFQQMRDEIINRIAALGGFIDRMNKLAKNLDENARTVLDEIKKIENIFKETGVGL
jgi:GAF domain-containing protein